MSDRPCIVAGSEYAEFCREYCLNYGTGRCHYDPETKKMMVRVSGNEEVSAD